MRHIIILAIALLTSIFTYSQISESAEITKSNVFPINKTTKINKIFQLKTGETISIKYIGEYLKIIYYDEALNIESESEKIYYMRDEKKSHVYMLDYYLTKDDNIAIFFSYKINKESRTVVWANILSTENEEMILSEAIQIEQIREPGIFNDFQIKTNEERSLFAYIYYEKVKNKQYYRIKYKVFDEDLEPVWENQSEEYTVPVIGDGSYRIANNGKLISFIPAKGENKKVALFKLIIHNSKGEIEHRFNVETEDNTYLFHFNLTVDKNSKLIVCKANIKKPKAGNYTGTFNFSVDLDNIKKPILKTNNFTEEITSLYETDVIQRKNKKEFAKEKNPGIVGLRSYSIVSHDNGYFFIMKQQPIIVEFTGAFYINYSYVINSYSNNDELIWTKKIPASSKSYYSNYFKDNFIYQNENLYFLHFDSSINFENFSNVQHGKRNYETNYLAIQKIDIDGEEERGLLYNANNIGVPIRKNSFSTLNKIPSNKLVYAKNNSTIFFFYGKDVATFLKVDINE